jgi:UDP-N-acetyl-D-galactosamine dehydrogenase
VEREHGMSLVGLDGRRYDLVVGAVAHREYRDFDEERLSGLLADRGTLADLRGMWRDRRLSPGTDRWTL